MPELPEVETIRLQLDKAITGLTIAGIEVLREKSWSGEIKEIRGRRVSGVGRRAKITLIELEGGLSLAIHLKMTGQLILRTQNQESAKGLEVSEVSEGEDTKNDEGLLRRRLASAEAVAFGNGGALVTVDKGKSKPYEVGELPNKYTRVVVSFSNGAKLYFNDLRMFGWIRVIRNSKFEALNPKQISTFTKVTVDRQNTKYKIQNDDDGLGLEKYGPEAIDESTFTVEYFQKILSKTGRAIKLVILDQEKLAGVGNIYANEALFRAGIRPDRKAAILGYDDTRILREEIIKVLREAIAEGGTSDKDEAFRQLDGSKGGFQKFLQVYNREGEACFICGTVIKKMKIGGRGSYWCPGCQK